MSQPQPTERTGSWEWLRSDGAAARAAHLFVLSALAIVQPLWTLLGSNAEFFVARNADRAEIVTAALVLLLVPPAVTFAVEQLVYLVDRRAGVVVHALAVAGFGALVFSRLFNHLWGDPGWLLVLLALGSGAGVAAYYATTRGARRVLTALTPLPVVLLAMFLLTSDVRPLVLPSAAEKTLKVSVRERAPVVFLVFDEFPGTSYLTPDLSIDPARAPNLAKFAQTATWYRDASTLYEVSEMAIPAILTGKRTPKKVLPTAASHPVNLFSLFTAAGYRVSASESLTRICTPKTCGGQARPPRQSLLRRVKSQLTDLGVVYGHDVLPADYADALPDISLTWGNFRGAAKEPAPKPNAAPAVGAAGVRTDIDAAQGPRFDQFIAGLTPSAEPALHYLHALVPHAPFDHLPNGKPYANGRSFIGIDFKTGYWDRDPFFTEQAMQRNLLQVGYADWQFGRVIDQLEQTGMFDKSLVVLVGDHGSSNRPGVNRRAFADGTLGDIASVPMFVKLPGQKQGRIDDRSAETVDLIPTIAGALGMTLPSPADGHDLADAAWRPDRKVLMNQFGREFVLSADFPERRESVSRIYGMFAHDGNTLNLFAMGPYKSLVGSSVAALGSPARAPVTAKLDNPEFWTTGAPAGWSPSHVTGKLSSAPSPVQLLVAVGDRIVATSRSYAAKGESGLLSIFVPDEALAPGHAPVRLFAVTGSAGSPALAEVSWR